MRIHFISIHLKSIKGGGDGGRRMGTQQRLKQFSHSFQREHIRCYRCLEKQQSIYVPLRFGGWGWDGGRRMGTQQRLKQFSHSFQREHISCYRCLEKQQSIIRTDSERFWTSILTNFLPVFSA